VTLCLPLAAASPHPMDPLNADEIVEAANIVLRGGRRGRARSSRASSCASGQKRGARLSRLPARAGRRSSPGQEELLSTVNLSAQTFTAPVLIPPSEGQLGLTITEVVDFSFAFRTRAS
jgi:hypothetical protein